MKWTEASTAALALGLNTAALYKSKRALDPRLPGDPCKYPGFPGWLRFLGKEKRRMYSSMNAAMKSVKHLKITTKEEYYKRYQEDSKLPSSPSNHWGKKWPGWGIFLGTKTAPLYSTWQQAARVTKKLGIKTPNEYKRRHKEDPRLPKDPPTYRGCKSWNQFFGIEPKNFYPTWQELALVCNEHQVSSTKEYRALCKEDKRLPLDPWDFYKDFPGFATFLKYGRSRVSSPYPSCEEASLAAKKLGITSSVKYREEYKRDPQLYASPSFLGYERGKKVQ